MQLVRFFILKKIYIKNKKICKISIGVLLTFIQGVMDLYNK
jgi:hypothetical protein